MEYATWSQPKFSYHKVSGKRKNCVLHLHSDYELYYLLNGDTKCFVNNEFFLLKPKSFIFIPKNALHYMDSENCLFNERLCFSFDESAFNSEMRPILEELGRVKLIQIPQKHIPATDEIIERLAKEHESSNPYKDQMMNAYFSILLTRLCRYKTDADTTFDEANRLFYNIAEYIKDNIKSDISLDMLCNEFSISKSHLSRKFKETLGMKFSEYLRYIRIQAAIKRLIGTSDPISKISEDCGFNDSNYFSTIFKETMGLSPLNYRQKNS